MDKSSNEIWVHAKNFDDWETSRPLLFREDMRDTFFNWFRIRPTDHVLDSGCATGVLTRFIARGLSTGTVTGFDISPHFVDFGNDKIKEEGLSDKAKIVLEDGFDLSFADNTFDTVVCHTYLGILSDPVAGLKEMIRVCKKGGNVSVSASAKNFPHIEWNGDCPFQENDKLIKLRNKQDRIYRKITNAIVLEQDSYWNMMRYPKMFAICGLTNIMLHPYAAGFSYNDSYWSDDFKRQKIMSGVGREIEFLEREKENPNYANNGFSNNDFEELILLYKQKQDYLLKNIYNEECWGWNASMHYILTGTKA